MIFQTTPFYTKTFTPMDYLECLGCFPVFFKMQRQTHPPPASCLLSVSVAEYNTNNRVISMNPILISVLRRNKIRVVDGARVVSSKLSSFN